MSPGVVDLNGIAGLAGIGYDEIASGVFDSARGCLFATTWNSPIEDEEPIVSSTLGKTTFLTAATASKKWHSSMPSINPSARPIPQRAPRCSVVPNSPAAKSLWGRSQNRHPDGGDQQHRIPRQRPH